MRKQNLVTLLGIPLLAIILSGCPQNYDDRKAEKRKPSLENTWIAKKSLDILKNYKDREEREIMKGDTYLDYARKLQQNPILKNVRRDEIAEYLRIINGENLKYGTERNPKFAKILIY
jgi:glutaredoxin 2